MEDAKFKICVFGDGGVGKTTLVNRYLTGLFSDPGMTLGVDFHIKWLDIEGQRIFLQIWDFAGEKRFRCVLPSYIIGSAGCIFMYDVTQASTINSLDDWLSVFEEEKKKNIDKEIPLIMVGGKIDLNQNREVQSNEALGLAQKNNFKDYLECSAKSGENVEEIFISITRLMMKNAGMI